MITQGKSNLLAPLGKQRLSKQDAEKILSFMQTIMYPGKQDEDFVETRIRIYEQQKNKSSLTLLPDKHSAEEHINSQTSKLTFGNNVSLKTLYMLIKIFTRCIVLQ